MLFPPSLGLLCIPAYDALGAHRSCRQPPCAADQSWSHSGAPHAIPIPLCPLHACVPCLQRPPWPPGYPPPQEPSSHGASQYLLCHIVVMQCLRVCVKDDAFRWLHLKLCRQNEEPGCKHKTSCPLCKAYSQLFSTIESHVSNSGCGLCRERPVPLLSLLMQRASKGAARWLQRAECSCSPCLQTLMHDQTYPTLDIDTLSCTHL